MHLQDGIGISPHLLFRLLGRFPDSATGAASSTCNMGASGPEGDESGAWKGTVGPCGVWRHGFKIFCGSGPRQAGWVLSEPARAEGLGGDKLTVSLLELKPGALAAEVVPREPWVGWAVLRALSPWSWRSRCVRGGLSQFSQFERRGHPTVGRGTLDGTGWASEKGQCREP